MPKSAMLRPKNHGRARKPFIPAISETSLGAFFSRLLPAERALLRHIAEKADLVQVPGAPDHLLVPMTPHLLDMLATFEAELEDREYDLDDEGGQDEDDDGISRAELDESDSEPDQAPAYVEFRDKFRALRDAQSEAAGGPFTAFMKAKLAGDPDATYFTQWVKKHGPDWCKTGWDVEVFQASEGAR